MSDHADEIKSGIDTTIVPDVPTTCSPEDLPDEELLYDLVRRLFLQKGLTFPFVEGVEYSRKEGVVTHEDQRSGSRRGRDQKEYPLL